MEQESVNVDVSPIIDTDNNKKSLADFCLERLNLNISIINNLSYLIGTLTASHLLLTIFTGYFLVGYRSFALNTDSVFHATITIEIVFVFLVSAMIFSFEKILKKSNVLYQEISDEFESHSSYINKEPSHEKISTIQMRVVLRRFVVESCLPLCKGDNCSIAYLGVNYILVFLNLYLWSSFFNLAKFGVSKTGSGLWSVFG